jgi:hypothetical protein
MSDSFSMTYQTQDIIPTIVSLPVNNPVTEVQTELIILQSNTNQVVYTLDGSAVLDSNNKISPTAILYYTPIHVTSSFTLKAVSFDSVGKFSPELIGKFAPATILPQAITLAPTTIIENGGITLSWVKPNDPNINGFGVEIFTVDGLKLGVTRVLTEISLVIKDLVPGTSYQFSVMTQSTSGSSVASPKTVPVVFPSPTDTITITSAKWIARKSFRVTGTGNVVATITLYSSTAAGTIGSIMTLRGSTIPITAPITCVGAVCQFDINLRNGIPLTNPGRIFVKSSSGGVSGPFVVA